MPPQMYLVAPKTGVASAGVAELSQFISHRRGFILLTTARGTLIALFDDAILEAVKTHHLVDFVGGVTLDLSGPAGASLHKLFAANVARHLGIEDT